ncbi:MAG: hypothetical protein R2799_04780 [Crocinitomicaceae bacterium]
MRWIIAFTLGIMVQAYSQSGDCTIFRNGKFKIESEVSGTSYIERKGNKQIETDVRSQMKIELKVKWIDECTYILSFGRVLKNPENTTFPEDFVIKVAIVEVHNNYYVQESTSEFFDGAIRSKVLKLD